ncbi:hypothetical protein RB6667 [Rhodopirellula baltica SH 1]|uniref:Uncharacterized protein n=1 Tax=Rhodopirellula baltica (strain DSM 10527 / NCIMB 13988 / SH1) TaxID=243090 RepID=Q7UPX5_RHOBA|nr:hypothetical protein RB6667 [Rhodopirellula baltica SH 1]
MIRRALTTDIPRLTYRQLVFRIRPSNHPAVKQTKERSCWLLSSRIPSV